MECNALGSWSFFFALFNLLLFLFAFSLMCVIQPMEIITYFMATAAAADDDEKRLHSFTYIFKLVY